MPVIGVCMANMLYLENDGLDKLLGFVFWKKLTHSSNDILTNVKHLSFSKLLFI